MIKVELSAMERTLSTNNEVLLGKEVGVKETIDNFSRALAQAGIEVEEVSWLNPVPNVWSVHLRHKQCLEIYSNGKGATRDAALASALGEILERLCCNFYFFDYDWGGNLGDSPFVHYPFEKWSAPTEQFPHDVLTDQLKEFYNPQDELSFSDLVDKNSGNIKRGVCSLPYVCQSDKKVVLFPVNILANIYVSNGMAAGNSFNEAKVQALSEILERFVKNKIISEEISLPDIPQSIINQFPKIREGIENLEEHGYKVLVKDCSLGGMYPVVNITLISRKDHGCYPAFGAHPKFEVALERTLTELLQGRGLDKLNDFKTPTFNSMEVASELNLIEHFIDSTGLLSWNFFRKNSDYKFVSWNFEGSIEQEFNHLCDLIHAQSKEIYIAEYDFLNVAVCQIIVPQMSEIYPISELAWNNNNSSVKLNRLLKRLPKLCKKEQAELFEMILDNDYDNALLVCENQGWLADIGDEWDRLRMGELKLYLAISLEDYEEALTACSWCHFFFENDLQTFYSLLKNYLEIVIQGLQFEDYKDLFCDIYNSADVEKIQQIFLVENPLMHLTEIDRDMSNFKRHHNILAIYRRLSAKK